MLITASSLDAGQVNLQWKDNSTNEAGFFVERRESGGEFVQIASTGPNENTFSDSSVVPSVVYEYRVNAYNSFGISEYTNVATTIVEANKAPTILRIEDVSVTENSPVNPIGITVADEDTELSELQFQLVSSNQNLIRNEDLFVLNQSGNYQISFEPNANTIGTSTINIAVSDGANEVSTQFNITIVEFAAPSGSLNINSIGTAPRANEMFEVALNIADPSDVRTVNFSIDGMHIGSSSTAPYSLETYVLETGIYEICAKVSFMSHANQYDFRKTLTVEQAPTDIVLVDNMQSTSLESASNNGTTEYDYESDSFRLSDNSGNVRTQGDSNLFHYMEVRGDSVISARVSDIENWNDQTVAGLMIRSSSDTFAAQASVLYRAGKDKIVQRYRTNENETGSYGFLKSETTGTAFLKLETSDQLVRVYLSDDGIIWQKQSEVQITLGETYLIGLALGGGNEGSLASAKFDRVQFEGELVNPIVNGKREVTSVSIDDASDKGGAYYDSLLDSYELYDVTGNIRTSGDSNRFYYLEAYGDIAITAKVTGFTNWNSETVAGIMIRSSLDPLASHASSLYRIGAEKVVTRYRALGGTKGDYDTVSPQTGDSSFLKLVKQGNKVTFYVSQDGQNWDLENEKIVELQDTFLAGLALGTKDSEEPVSVRFEQVKIESL